MKKLFLALIAYLSFTDLYATNCTPIVFNYTEEKKQDIFNTILKYSFVTARLPENIKELKPEEITEIAKDENGIIERKIKEVDSGATVCFIPKTLYQLFAFRYIVKEYHKVIGNDKYRERQVWKKKWETEEGVGFLPKDKTLENGLLAAIRDYHKSETVQSEFWNINNSIRDWLKEHKISDWLAVDEGTKLEHIAVLIEDTLKSCGFKIVDSYYDIINADYAKHFTEKLNCTKDLIGKLIIDEEKAQKGTYRIYRGEEYYFRNKPKEAKNSYSFSDGLFAGIVRDFAPREGGSAFLFAIERGNLIFVDLPKKKLLETPFSEVPIIIPPVIYIGALLGKGELHHVRTKLIGTKFDKSNGFVFGDGDIEVKMAEKDIELFSLNETEESVKNMSSFLKLLDKTPEKERKDFKFKSLKIFGWDISSNWK